MTNKDKTKNQNWMKRPVFKDNQRLTPERLNRVQDHHIARLRMALLGLAGPGVIYGFEIDTDSEHKCTIEKGSIKIGCGLAIDCHGRQLYWPGGLINVDMLCGEPPTCPGKYILNVHFAERRENDTGNCGCNEEETEWLEEGVVFTLKKECPPNCDVCPDHRCECVDICDYVCGRTGSDDLCIPVDECLNNLCENPADLCSSSCDDWLYDDSTGLPLACMEICDLAIGKVSCDQKLGFCPCEPEVCRYRTYVYRNPVLYELIRGCHIDLARVKNLCFMDWLNTTEDSPLAWNDFENKIKDGLQVHFTKPIKTTTLTKSSLIFTALIQEYESLFLDTLRMPIDTINMLEEENDCAKGVEIKFDQDWLDRQITSEISWPSRFNSGANIEFTVRGAMLRDKCDCMLDGRPLDIPDNKPGQEMPGDDFIVTFCVEPKPRSDTKGGDE